MTSVPVHLIVQNELINILNCENQNISTCRETTVPVSNERLTVTKSNFLLGLPSLLTSPIQECPDRQSIPQVQVFFFTCDDSVKKVFISTISTYKSKHRMFRTCSAVCD